MLEQDLVSRILKAVDSGFDAQTQCTAELVRHPSTRGNEHTAQDFMARQFADHGLSVDRWRIDIEDIEHLPGFSPVTIPYDNTFNVVGAYRSTRRGGRSLILNGHIDVVPEGPHEHWTAPPYEPRIADGWMYGRGSGDMKAGLVGCLYALEALRDIGMQPAADVYLQSVVEEECTGNGALACLQRGYRADAAFIPEPLHPQLMRAQVGVIWFQLRVAGDPQHASGFQSAGANAIEKAYVLMRALRELEAKWNGEKHQHHPFDALEHPIRFNFGKIAGGDWTSSVPAWCHLDVRIGVYPGRDLAEVREEVETCIREAARSDPFLADKPPEIVYNGFQAEGYVLADAEDAESALARSHRQVFGEELKESPTPATTDARFFGLYADTPALVYGPVCARAHGFDECVDLDSTRKVTQTMALFIAEWCGLEPV